MIEFPNGEYSWAETLFEVTAFIERYTAKDVSNPISAKLYELQMKLGYAGMVSKAIMLTNEFEKLNVNRMWDGEFYDEVHNFMVTMLKVENVK